MGGHRRPADSGGGHAVRAIVLGEPTTRRAVATTGAFRRRLGSVAAAVPRLAVRDLIARAYAPPPHRSARALSEAIRAWCCKAGTPREVGVTASTVARGGRTPGRLAAWRGRARGRETAARGREAGFRQLFAANPHPMWVYDIGTLAFLEVNDAAVARYGYGRAEFLRLRLTDIRPPEDVAPLLADVARTRASDLRLASRWRHRTRAGQLLDVEITSHALTFGGRRARLVVAQDITGQVRAETALRASEARLLALHEASLTLAAERDPRRVLEGILQRAVALLGAGSGTFYRWDAAAGLLRCAYNWRVPASDTTPDQRPGEGLAGQAFVRGAALIVNDYLAWAHAMPTGMVAGLRAALSVPLIRGGAALGVAVVRAYDDATRFTADDARLLGLFADQAAIALENAELTADLERRVGERTAQLAAANRELEAFAYSVSHDLRAPLRGIDGFSQALLEDYGDRLDGDARDYLARIRAGSQRMGRLIDDLLALSRLSRRPLRAEAVDLSALARAVADELRQATPGRAAVVDVAPGLTARADAGLVRAVLTNLLENAWKFTGRQPHPRIAVGRAGATEPAVFFVRDNGAGFDMAYADKLFGAFQRLHAEHEFPGSGIGLATVQRIVHRHGGEAWAEGAVGAGATFYFTLAARPGATAGGEGGS